MERGEDFQITEIYLSRLKHIVAKFQGFTYYIKAIVIEYVRKIDRVYVEGSNHYGIHP